MPTRKFNPVHLMGCLMLAAVTCFPSTVAAQDRHAGYYYPPPETFEVYPARGPILPDSNKRRRIGFIVGLTEGMLGRPYPPEFAVFAKGAEAEKMIIVALRDGYIDTLYRGRGLLAQMTAIARATPIFEQHGVEDYFTFFDFARLMGFRQLTISDGKTYAHQVTFE